MQSLSGRRYTSSNDVGRAMSIDELRAQARRRLPRFVFEYLDGGAEDEVTLRRNREVFEQLQFLPRTLVAAGAVDMSTQIFGRPTASPMMIAPVGFCGLLARDGDLAMARAAAAFGMAFVQSTVSNTRLETVAEIEGLRRWMQLYVFRSRDSMETLVRRAEVAGCEALVVTTDATVFGNREWDRRNYRVGTDPSLRNKIETLRHPRWLREVALPGVPPFANLLDMIPPEQRTLAGSATWTRYEVDPNLDWARLAWLRSIWRGRLVIKGVLSVEDAARARDVGADGIVLTNHGGRQLDGVVSPMTVLPEIAARFSGDLTILIDSGFRRGTDVVKALALGAHAVLIGRAAAYGLAAGGEAGASRALTILHDEVRRTLALLGRPTLAQLGPDCILQMRERRFEEQIDGEQAGSEKQL